MKSVPPLFFLVFLLFPSGGLPLAAETVSALGRVHPVSRVIDLYAPSGQIVAEVFVEEGNSVQAGQPLLRFASRPKREAELRAARTDLTHLEKVHELDLRQNELQVRRLEKEVNISRARYDQILESDTAQFAAPDLLTERELAWIRSLNELESARLRAEQIRLSAADSIRRAERRVAEAESALEATELRSPLQAVVLKRLVHPGMTPSSRELFKLGDTRQMIVVAEVYESDIHRIEPGQAATVTSPALEAPLTGKVLSRGYMIYKDTVDSLDPTALTNSRVVEAVILLDRPEPVRGLVFLQVDVEIDV